MQINLSSKLFLKISRISSVYLMLVNIFIMTSNFCADVFWNIIIIFIDYTFWKAVINFDNTIILCSLIDSNIQSKEKSTILTMNEKSNLFGGGEGGGSENRKIEKAT